MMISMGRDDLAVFRSGFKGAAVRCEKGRIWVTVAGDSRDHILAAGEEIAVASRNRVVIMAENSSKVRVFVPFQVRSWGFWNPGARRLQEMVCR